MTEKDYHKIKSFRFDNLSLLKISLEIIDIKKFLKKIKKKYEKKN